MIKFPLISRLANGIKSVSNSGINQISTHAFPLLFRATPTLWAEPLKKKKKLDPGVIKAREEKKRKRIQKEIRRLQKLAKQLKPISDIQVPECLTEEAEQRKRNTVISEKEAEERILLLKEWSKIKFKKSVNDKKELNRLINSQKKALNELRLESEELYQAAVRIDESLIPFKFRGPTETPPKEDYTIPDGAYIDVSKKWT